MIARAMLRHMLPVGLSTMCVFVLWVVGTLPMVAVFLIDDAFVMFEYVRFLAYAFGVAFGLSVAVLLPLALFGEVLAKRNKHTIWIFPGFLCLCTGTVLMVRIIILKSLLDAFLSWSGFIVLVSVVFVLYWTVLWTGKAALVGWQKFREQRHSNESLETDPKITEGTL